MQTLSKLLKKLKLNNKSISYVCDLLRKNKLVLIICSNAQRTHTLLQSTIAKITEDHVKVKVTKWLCSLFGESNTNKPQ